MPKEWKKGRMDKAVKDNKEDFNELQLKLFSLMLDFCRIAVKTFQATKRELLNILEIMHQEQQNRGKSLSGKILHIVHLKLIILLSVRQRTEIITEFGLQKNSNLLFNLIPWDGLK